MKKSLLLILLSCLCVAAFPKPQNLRAYLSYSTFFSPQHGPYLETYLSILGSSVVYTRKDNGKYQASVMITMLFKQHDSIKDFRKYELSSPEVDDTASVNFSFIDQQRVPLPAGNYDLELSIADKNRDKAPFTVNQEFSLDFPANKLTISGIELVESFKKTTQENPLSKSGYDFIPYMDDFYPEQVNKLTYYAEVYNSGSRLAGDDKFLINTSIQSFENNKLVSSYFKAKRDVPKTVNVVFGEFDISSLPSGNYNLLISVRDKNNQELASNQVFFQRSNPSIQYNLNDIAAIDISNSFTSKFQNPDTLRENIRCLFPIATSTEKLFIRSQLKEASLENMQKFFHLFWESRDAMNPMRAWNEYSLKVQAVELEFHAINKKGYETERGRVYLQYGPPDTRSQSYDEPRAYPYEIWQYYKIGSQSNCKFIFCQKERATGDFDMIHSDVVGEIKNRRWEIALHERDTDRFHLPQDVDRESEDDYFGKRTRDYYDIPR